ncbi:hypothetical protein H7X87_02695 [Acetobacteraceae bacterium]|nr:hypothetical protein [Candidatus Parcubacteria bacterium]
MLIGFIGQGFIGKNYADDFERRGFSVVRYSLEEPYRQNKDKISSCDFVFIAVPTPTTLKGHDDSILRAVLPLVGPDKVVVIKSTILPGTTKKFQEEFPDRIILHSPEFLAEKTAAFDASNPKRNIIGIAKDSPLHHAAAQDVLSILPQAPYKAIVDSNASELIKYAGNTFLFFRVLYANFFYDLSQKLGVDYEQVKEAIAADPRIGPSHLKVIDDSGHPGARLGRGAGGHCLIKDFAALREIYEALYPQDKEGLDLLRAFEAKNAMLLKNSEKDLDLLQEVYGTNQA